MVLKFQDYIEEGLWSKGVDRSKTGDMRTEQGKKVHTSIGVDIIIQNQLCDYEYFIKEFLNNINSRKDLNIKFIKNEKHIRNTLEEVEFIINENIIARFPYYTDLIKYDVFDENELSEPDYLSIIKGISEKLSQLNTIEKYEQLNTIQIGVNKGWNMYMILIDEKNTKKISNSFTTDNYWDEGFLDKFQNALISEFNKEIDIYLIDDMVVLKIDYDSIVNYDKLLIYVKDYFYDELNEGLWSKGVDRSKTGEERSENKITSNIDQLNPVDLHDKLKINFADDILIYDGKELFTGKEMLDIQNGLLEEYNNRPGFNYWYIPHESDIKDMLKIKSLKFSKDENGNLVITNKRTKTEFKTNGKVFWCNSMMGQQVWYYDNGIIEICDPKYLWKEEANILLYR